MPPPVLFMHIHKTAGTSITRWLDGCFAPERICPLNVEHAILSAPSDDLARYELFRGHISPAALQEKLGAVRVVTCLRDPVARLRSAWRYWRQAAIEDRPGITPMIRAVGDMSFNNFLMSPLTRPAVDNVQWRLLHGARFGAGPTQRTLVYGGRGEQIELAAIGVAEQLSDTLARFARALDLPPPLVTPRENVQGDYDGDAGDPILLEAVTQFDAVAHARVR